MKTSVYLSVAAFLINLLFFSFSDAKAQTLLYKVSGNELEHPSYLFGTYHVIGSNFFEQHPEVMKAYDQSENVVVEVIMDSSKLQNLAMMGMMPENSLTEFFDSTEYALIDAAVQESVGYPLNMLNQLKPMNISVMLSLAYIQALEIPEDLGGGIPMDQYFAQEAENRDKGVIAFETMEEQGNFLFNSTSLEQQAEELLEFVNAPEEMSKYTQTLNTAYLEGDEKAIEKLYTDLPKGNELMHVIIDKRNANWMEKIPAMIQKESAFIAVGALHLYGEKGLIESLEEMGYTIERVDG